MKADHIFRLTGKGADQDPKGVFSINRLTGEVAVSRALDREAIAYYHVSVLVEQSVLIFNAAVSCRVLERE